MIAQNLIGRCDNAGIFGIVRPDRANGGTGTGNTVAGNIFAKCKSAINFLNPGNKADGNVYVDLPRAFQGLFEGVVTRDYDPDAWQKIRFRDLEAWRALHGWDKNSVIAEMQIDFDTDTLQLTIASAKPLPRLSAMAQMQSDMLGKPAGKARVAGPLVFSGTKAVLHVDPRVPG